MQGAADPAPHSWCKGRCWPPSMLSPCIHSGHESSRASLRLKSVWLLAGIKHEQVIGYERRWCHALVPAPHTCSSNSCLSLVISLACSSLSWRMMSWWFSSCGVVVYMQSHVSARSAPGPGTCNLWLSSQLPIRTVWALLCAEAWPLTLVICICDALAPSAPRNLCTSLRLGPPVPLSSWPTLCLPPALPALSSFVTPALDPRVPPLSSCLFLCGCLTGLTD
jgi:hypothetical protein